MRILGTVASSSREVPGAPTIGTATNNGTGRTFVSGGRADVTFTAPAFSGGLPILDYTVTSSPGSLTATGAGSPLSVTGLTPATSYTFTVTARTAIGTGPASAASNSITATTIPQVPTITSATRTDNTTVSIAFTGATGGAALSAVTATSSPSVSITSSGTSSPMTATATYVTGTSYTFTITATNANGTSTASNTSSAVTPFPQPVLGAWSSGTSYPSITTQYRVGVASSDRVWVGTGTTAAFDTQTNLGYYWSGGSWVASNYGASVYAIGMGKWDNSTLIGIGGYLLSNDTVRNTSYYNTSGSPTTWTSSTTYPIGVSSNGMGRISDGFISGPGSGGLGQNNTYSLSALGGSYTLRATFPLDNNGVRGGGSDYTQQNLYIKINNSVSMYKISSITGAWSTSTNAPLASNESPMPFICSIGTSNLMFLHPNDGSGGAGSTYNTYLFNGSTFTTSTALPSGGYGTGQWAGGARDNVVSALPSPTGNQTIHYIATLS